VLLKGYENTPIFHLNNAGSEVPYVKYPFTSLPYLQSHIRPQFAIFNAGLKLTNALEQQENLINSSPDFLFVLDLFDAWNRRPPTDHLQDPSYFPPKLPNPSLDDDNDDVDYVEVDDEDEDPHYEDQTSNKKRKWRAAQKVPPKTSKRKSGRSRERWKQPYASRYVTQTSDSHCRCHCVTLEIPSEYCFACVPKFCRAK